MVRETRVSSFTLLHAAAVPIIEESGGHRQLLSDVFPVWPLYLGIMPPLPGGCLSPLCSTIEDSAVVKLQISIAAFCASAVPGRGSASIPEIASGVACSEDDRTSR